MRSAILFLLAGCGAGAPVPAPTAPGPEPAMVSQRIETTLASMANEPGRHQERTWFGASTTVRGGLEPCLLAWRTVAPGRDGKPLLSVTGETYVPAGAERVLEGSGSVPTARANLVDHADTTWSARCGADLPGLHAGLVEVTGVHRIAQERTEVTVRSDLPHRCTFDVRVVDFDARGLGVRTDRVEHSVPGGGAVRTLAVPVGIAGSGLPEDWAGVAKTQRAFVEKVRCMSPQVRAIGDVQIGEGSFRSRPWPDSAFRTGIWASFGVTNPKQTPCAWGVRVAALDADGYLIDSRWYALHLRPGATTFHPQAAIPVWNEQVADVASVEVVDIRNEPQGCDAFDPLQEY